MSKRTKGILCIIASAFCFALMSTFVRLSGDLPSVQKSFFRNFVAMFIALAVLLKEGGGLKLQKGCLPLHLLRSIAGTLGILGNFYAVDHLVLSNASMLNKMSPFFVLVFSYFILKEKLKPTQVVIVAVAFLGSLFIIKPVALFPRPRAHSMSHQQRQSRPTTSADSAPDLPIPWSGPWA